MFNRFFFPLFSPSILGVKYPPIFGSTPICLKHYPPTQQTTIHHPAFSTLSHALNLGMGCVKHHCGVDICIYAYAIKTNRFVLNVRIK